MSCYMHDNKRQNSNRRPSMQFQPVFPEMHVRKNPPKRFTAPCENYHKAKLLPTLPYPISRNLRRKPRDLTFLAQISPSYSNDAHYEYAMDLRSGLMLGVLSVWLRNRKKQNAEELFLIIRNELEIWRKGDFAI